LIQSEIVKGEPLLDAGRAVCLVVAVLHLSKDVQMAMRVSSRPTLLLTEGHWHVPVDGKLVKNSGDKNVLTVKKGMEVLILGSKALSRFIGKSKALSLQSVFDSRRRYEISLFCWHFDSPFQSHTIATVLNVRAEKTARLGQNIHIPSLHQG
jgi:hypothetical protein